MVKLLAILLFVLSGLALAQTPGNGPFKIYSYDPPLPNNGLHALAGITGTPSGILTATTVTAAHITGTVTTATAVGHKLTPGNGLHFTTPGTYNGAAAVTANADWSTATANATFVPLTRTVTANAPITGGGALSSNISISITQSGTASNGYLSSTDWNIFNGKESVLTFVDPLIRTVNSIKISTASATGHGSLSSADWNTFNNKVSTSRQIISGAGLTGGGDLSADRTLVVGAGTGITVNADDVQLSTIADQRVFANISGGIAVPSANTLTAIIDACFGGANGDFMQRISGSWDDSAYTLPTTVPTTGKILISDGTNLVGSTPTYPNASPTSGKILQSDGTNIVASAATWPTAATSGKIVRGNGTNYVESTPTWPNAGTTGKLIVGDGTNYVESTPTFPSASPTLGTYLRGDGTNWIDSTLVLPNAATVNQIVRATSTNTYGGDSSFTADGTSVILTNSSSAPSYRVTTGALHGLYGVAINAGDLSNVSAAGDTVLRADGTGAQLILTGRNSTGSVVISTNSPDVARLTITAAGAATFSGALTVTGNTTLNGAANLNGTNTSANPIQFQTGAATNYAFSGGTEKVDTTQNGSPTAGTADLTTRALPAGTLATNGASIEFNCAGIFAANGNNKTVTVNFGGTALITSGAVAVNGGSWHAFGRIYRTGATTQKAVCTLIYDTALVATTSLTNYTTPAETLSGAITFKCTGTGTVANDVTQQIMDLKYWPNGN